MIFKNQILVIDTNVAIVANGNSDHVSIDCQIACADLIEQCAKLNIALDYDGMMMTEYRKHLSHAGQPGQGDAFFKYLHDNQHAHKKVKRYTITPVDDGRGFDELPDNELDPSDHKFLATAVVAKAMIINATDSDWDENINLLEQLNINVHQLCPEHCRRTN